MNDKIIFSSPVRKYRKSYCSHFGVGLSVGVGVALMLKFLVKVFISLYFLNMRNFDADKLILCMLVDIGLNFILYHQDLRG